MNKINSLNTQVLYFQIVVDNINTSLKETLDYKSTYKLECLHIICSSFLSFCKFQFWCSYYPHRTL